MEKEANLYRRKRRIFAGVSLTIAAVLILLATLFIWRWLASFSKTEFRDYINSFGLWSPLVLLALQILQVFIALIPGELLESCAGLAFGPFMGTVICYVGIAIGTVLIFLLTRKFGIRLVETFISREKINSLRFINTEKRRDALVFLLFFIPGTPKDLITYFIGLTDIQLSSFLAISLTARIPSVLTSTIGGHMLGTGQYLGAVILYAATAAISLLGILLYRYIVKKKTAAK
ncbi:MAG: TVP38/TMEM64 family protein [Clostridia bacterium]|nr:TVP38/TMEM64 family protein [Clostridia bacterium]